MRSRQLPTAVAWAVPAAVIGAMLWIGAASRAEPPVGGGLREVPSQVIQKTLSPALSLEGRGSSEGGLSLAGRGSKAATPQDTADHTEQAPYQRRGGRGGGGVYKARIAPQWAEDSSHFWYRNDLREGGREFILVRPEEGSREKAFDHERLAAALREQDVEDAQAERLPIDDLAFDLSEGTLTFAAGDKRWQCKLESYELSAIEEPADNGDDQPSTLLSDVPRASSRTGAETNLTFENRTDGPVEIFWLDTSGERQSYGQVAPGQRREQHTYAGHAWEVRNGDGRTLAFFEAEEGDAVATITGEPGQRPQSRRGARRGARGQRGQRGSRGTSPDGQWTAEVQGDSVTIRATEEGGEVFELREDGEEGLSYEMLQWSPDSKTLVVFRVEPGDRHEVHLIESSPEEGGRAQLRSRPYALPGDKFSSYELNLFRIDDRQLIKPDVERIDFGRPRIRWNDEGDAFTYEKVDRGHQRFRLIEVDAASGEARNLIDERTETFIWTAHTENVELDMVNWLEESDEIAYVSERDGWRHLYLVDANEGGIKHQITQGDWVVRGIDRIDEENRQIWFRASGRSADQDPYLIHYYRINFDGNDLVALTEGNGQHTIDYSPDRRYIVDTYSRVDMPPVHELRRASDGSLVYELEKADITELEESGWEAPEVFTAKGRDGQTDIWGIIARPRELDPNQKYPVIEYIYAGPQGSYVPKTFSATRRFSSLTDLGFIVVQCDGMGTANRSKAFHDVCWQDLKDAGLPDRILWHQAIAEQYPYYDLERVGIYGTSAGGQNSTGAVLFHPEFYKAAVSACGCHDNRMDKASWNEQWMGYPVGPHYAECSNIDNAHRLQGDLMLIVGEMDSNVPPESTIRLADALIDAGKDFDLVYVPGAGHGMGGSYGQRRMEDFFVLHLLGEEPPNRNAPDTRTLAAADGTDEEETEDTEENDAEEDDAETSDDQRDVATRPIDLTSIDDSTTEVDVIARRYATDRESLERFYNIPESPTRQVRMRKFYDDWLSELATIDEENLSDDARSELVELKEDLYGRLDSIRRTAEAQAQISDLVTFAPAIVQLSEARQKIEPCEPREVAGSLHELSDHIARLREDVEAKVESGEMSESGWSQEQLARATETSISMRSVLKEWYDFYNGYDPLFTWWVRTPYEAADKELEEYVALLEEQSKTDEEVDEQDDSEAASSSASGASSDENDAAPEGDVPDVRRLLAQPRGVMPAVIAEYSAEQRRMRGNRRGRRSQQSENNENSENSRERRAERLNAWLAALEKLDFDSFDQSDRVDYLLFKNHLELQRLRLANQPSGRGQRGTVQDESGIRGRPIGREALITELRHEMIPYTPEELIEIAEQEYAWCRAELLKASREMGLGDDWRAAVEKVKRMHVEPGKQPALIRELAQEAVDYLKEHDLISVPPVADETWRMRMMSPQRQLVNPFFTGGEVISVSFPTDSMSHDAKLQSMLGNNVPFARATVHHELIPGHHLQGYMTGRYQTHRRLFSTPFWGEGWALYWEMLLYERGFPQTPEDRIGFLVWRSHRCARIAFSLGFHLGQMSPQECVDYLVDRVGFERYNAEAEVRRSFEGSYIPLYQAAYMLGGLQFRELHRSLVGSGQMTDRQFHDAVLRENSIPVEMVRAILTEQPLSRDFTTSWRFYEQQPAEAAPQ